MGRAGSPRWKTTFVHDATAQLTSGNGGSLAWTYDGAYNFKTVTTGGIQNTYLYNTSVPNDVQQANLSGTVRCYSYDNHGDATNSGCSSGVNLSYDGWARLTNVTQATGGAL